VIPWLRILQAAVGLSDLAKLRAVRQEEARNEADRERADRAYALERLRQVGDREIVRLQVMTRVAAFAWVGTLVAALFSGRLLGGSLGARIVLGCGWALLLAALVVAMTAQSRITHALAAAADSELRRGFGNLYVDDVTAGVGAATIPWLIAAGLAAVGVAALIG
jgi:hypothetical protein